MKTTQAKPFSPAVVPIGIGHDATDGGADPAE